ncbi:ABC transporter substrate-binding protein [bacterium]|nr:ABC transporter substrate-binding protein [bacterium]
MNRYAAFVLLFAAAAALASCGKPPSDPVPRRLTVAIPRDAGNVTPYTAGDAHSDFLLELVYDKLMAPSPYVGRPMPHLAESVRRVDSRTWRVRLRSGIRWHDGVPFGADDVKFTFDYYRDGPVNRWSHHTSKVPNVQSVFVEDSRTLTVVCADPCPAFDLVTAADLPIIPKHVWNGITAPRTFTDTLPVGTGPYRLVEHAAEQFYRFKANTEYFLGAPAVDEIVMPIIKDPSTTFIALKTGEIDAAARILPPELIEPFRRIREIKVVRTHALSGVEALMNFKRLPFSIKEFRKALNLAVDRHGFVETIVLGRGKPGSMGYPHPESPWTKSGIHIPFDQAASRAILDKLAFVDRDSDGFRESPDGKPFEITLSAASTEPTHVRAAELLAPQLAAVGLKARIKSLEPGAFRKFAGAHDFDIQISSITPHSVADPDQFVMSHKSGYLWREGVPYPEMDALIERWQKSESVEERRQAGFAMQELFNEFPTSLILYYPDEYWAYRPGAYAGWAQVPGQGIVHKWSFLSRSARAGIAADVVER